MKVILNTKQRITGSSSSKPSWTLSPPIHDYTNIKVRKVIMPNILYSFDTNNNTIKINNSTVSLPTNKRYSLISQFLTDINAAVPTIANITSFVFSFKDTKGVLSVTYTSSIAITLSANSRLGLPNDVYLPAATGGTYDFTGNFSLINSKVIYLALGRDFGTSDVRTSLKYGNILSVIPQGVWGQIDTYENSDDDFIEIEGGETISQISLEFYDSYGRDVDFRNEDVIVELSLRK